ncbi:MAG: hypothetical protein GY849_02500 [Deltaproteobacteria bacterium]|nr:hypothetical protein [Deltaproteobacteria bacterium]
MKSEHEYGTNVTRCELLGHYKKNSNFLTVENFAELLDNYTDNLINQSWFETENFEIPEINKRFHSENGTIGEMITDRLFFNFITQENDSINNIKLWKYLT